MIKKTLYIGSAAHLSTTNEQIVVRYPEEEDNEKKEPIKKTMPIEDVGIVVFDHHQITTTLALIQKLVDNNIAIVTCDARHMPSALTLALEGNTIQSERYRAQIEASQPMVKGLWQQTVQNKIENQAAVIKDVTGILPQNMLRWASSVKSGDPNNYEGRAAAFYWTNVFDTIPEFRRERLGFEPNSLLNYGYAILRSIIARSLVAAGLLPSLGIHHHNRYNAYCLADDIMEPYRPYVDKVVIAIVAKNKEELELTKEIKQQLLVIPSIDVTVNGRKSPLMIAAQSTAASLAQCFNNEARKIAYPQMLQ